jgi:hypothetical protein
MTFESHNPARCELVGTYAEHDEAETNVRLQRAWDGWQIAGHSQFVLTGHGSSGI